MRIYHNIPALTAYNSLSATNTAMEKSIQKLSTGLRINSAADDAAGFAISEKMRSQINGLNIAIRNTQDATSMLQVAEGALGETNSMLQRMRELSVQASNDTLTSQDRSYIQLEIDQLVDQINRVATTTQFNKKRLLDGSSAGITSSSNLSVKAFVRGSLREIDQFGQKKSFEGNYKIKVTVDPNQTGQGQVQKSAIMTIKHPNVITNVETNSNDGIVKVAVDNLPAANFEVTADTTAPTAATATISSFYGFGNTSDNPVALDDVNNYFTTTPSATADINNASILFEITSTSEDSITLKAQSNILGLDGTVNSAVMENIILKYDGTTPPTVDLSKLVDAKDANGAAVEGAFTMSFGSGVTSADDLAVMQRGNKFVLNVRGFNGATTTTAADMAVNIAATQDPDWPYNWADNTAGVSVFGDTDPANPNPDRTISYNLNSAACQEKDLHFRNYYLDSQRGTIYDGDVIVTTDSKFDAASVIQNGDVLSKFTAAYIGKTATGDTKLRDLNTFWNTSGVFMLDNPQTITITQGDGKKASVTLYATDTLNEVRAKFNSAIANDLGQSQYVDGAYSDYFCTFVEKTQGVDMPAQGLETVPGTFIFRSLLAGPAGDLTFSGDEDLINTLAFNVVKDSSVAAFQASIYDAHTGTPIATNVKVSDNHLIGILHENVDIEFDAMAGVQATWSEAERNFILTPQSRGYEATVHIVDSSTVFQIGANEGEDIAIDIGNMSAASLGITKVNVATRETATKAIGIIDHAIIMVSSQRAKIGAYQNALDYTSENLTTTMTNLSAAESRIRDADMAQEMMEFVKLQILNQSGTSMLAQANQLPQSVLSLLQ
ncbi:MAG: flagellin [Synergistaceae bacterium]|nr:flagellin [Synergistaceae bacterium]